MILGGACEYVSPSSLHSTVGNPTDHIHSPEARLWAIKEIVKSETDASTAGMAKHYILGYIKTWGESEDSMKAVMSVVEERLTQPWPCNYKALDVLDQMPAKALVGVMGKIADLTKKTGDEGKHLKALATPLLAKAQKEKDAKEAEEAKKREAHIAAAWGGLVNPAAITTCYPPTLSFGCPGGVNYFPHYLRPNLTAQVCPVLRCTPSWQPCVHMQFHLG